MKIKVGKPWEVLAYRRPKWSLIKKVDSVITGNIGPNAFKVLSAASINVFSGVTGTVEKAIEKIKSGQLKTTSAPDAPSHFGTGPKWNE